MLLSTWDAAFTTLGLCLGIQQSRTQSTPGIKLHRPLKTSSSQLGGRRGGGGGGGDMKRCHFHLFHQETVMVSLVWLIDRLIVHCAASMFESWLADWLAVSVTGPSGLISVTDIKHFASGHFRWKSPHHDSWLLYPVGTLRPISTRTCAEKVFCFLEAK